MERAKRKEVVRRGPRRNSTLGVAGVLQGLVDGGMDVAQQTARASRAVVQGAVESTVATAYTVIEQYMNRGYSAASLHYRTNGGRAMSDPQSRRGGPSWPGAYAPWTPWTMLMEPWLQWIRLWSDSAYAFGGQGNPMNPFSSLMGLGGNPGVSVEVQSNRPTAVTLDLAAGADFQKLRVGQLRHTTDSDAKALEGATVSARPGLYTVKLTVSDDLAPGVYVGQVENEWGQALGDLRVEIKGPAKVRKPRARGRSK